jgi:hypothetical protein
VADKGLLNLVIKATDKASPNIRRVGKALGEMGKVGTSIKKDLKVAAVGVAGLAAGVVAFSAQAAMAAANDQASTATLIASLKARKFNTDKLGGAIDDLIQKGQDLAFTDDQVRGSIEVSTRFTKNFTVAQKISAAAMNLSRSTGMDLQEATAAVGKAFQGNGAKILKSIGINDKHLSGMKAINAIMGQTKGATTAYANSAKGQFEILGIKVSELKESFGYALLPAITKVFKSLNPQLTDFATWVQSQMPKIQGFADTLANQIIARLPGLFAKLKTEIPKALAKVEDIAKSIGGIGKSADKLLGPDGAITVLVTAIGASFGGLKGAISANLIKNGVDPFTALIAGNILQVIPGALAEVFVKSVVTKAIATFGAEVAAASAGGAIAAGVGGAAAGAGGTAAAGVGIGALAIAALPEILAAAAVVAAVAGLAMVVKTAMDNPVTNLTTQPGFDAPNIFDILFPKKGAFSTSVGLGTNSSMSAKYEPSIVVQIGEKKLDVIVTDALGRTLKSGAR